MSTHDELCPVLTWEHAGMTPEEPCQCALIARVVEREREKAAAAIDAEYQQNKYDFGPWPSTEERWYLDGLERAEMVVRGE